MNAEEKVLGIIGNLAKNAASMRKCINKGDLEESVRLMGERVALIEDLRAFKDAKVSIVSSDIKDEMNSMMESVQVNFSETMKTIRAKNAASLEKLAKMGNVRRIAAYKISQGITLGQGERHGC